jgi:hypothetical protein
VLVLELLHRLHILAESGIYKEIILNIYSVFDLIINLSN